MLTKYQWRECRKDEKNITSNDNKGTEVGYKNANKKTTFCTEYGIVQIQNQSICESTVSKRCFALTSYRLKLMTLLSETVLEKC